MGLSNQSGKYVKFAGYLVAVVLLNLVGLTLLFRADLTADRIYSISDVSKKVVSSLKEPLTVKVFFTKNLPAPHNNTERYLHDLLEEYALYGNKYFSYQFYDVSPESESGDAKAEANRKMAEDYGINPVQIRQLEKDEVKFKRAYMGLVIIHGDVVEQISPITSTDGLEYRLTAAMMKANNKISALLGLPEKIQVKLILSSSLTAVAPYMKVPHLPQLPDDIKKIVQRLNVKNYGQLSFSRLDPQTDQERESLVDQYHLPALQWPAIDGGRIPAGKGVIGLVMSYKEKSVSLPIFQAVRLPIIGTQYSLADTGDMEEMINQNIDSLVNINEEIGYLADHGTAPLASPMPFGPAPPDTLSTFSSILQKSYSVRSINLAKETIPPSVKCVVIARPTQHFTDWELFQIDQALMRGQNLAIFLSPFKEVRSQPPNSMGFGRPQVTYEPLDTGLEKLLKHYGVSVRRSIVLDKDCFMQKLPERMGGGERPIYFAPIIKNWNINKTLPFMRNIKGIIALAAAPLELDKQQLKKNGIKATLLFSSSDKSWEMNPPIRLEPEYISQPGGDTHFEKKPLAYLLSGEFTSYFAGKPVPEKESDTAASEKTGAAKNGSEGKKGAAGPEAAKIQGKTSEIEKGKPARIFITGSAKLLSDQLLDPDGRSPNAVFVMNTLDKLNNREGMAVMRAKTQELNPLEDTDDSTKAGIKAFNIVGLPILVALFGLMIWGLRHNRKKKIQMLFTRTEE
jgi:ABC-type uncharacterized transport system involved in gliding motility auxiliary subunit